MTLQSEQTRNWQLVETLFDTLLDLPVEQRTEVLGSAHTQYPQAVIADVERLLAKLDDADTFLETGATEAARVALQVLQPGDQVGAWKVLGLIGVGGQGEVYQVERLDPGLQQTGALKVSRQRHSGAGIKRFLRERQVLAQLMHPGIPTLLDGGLTADDQPYLVSEYITGKPIDKYVQEQNISLNARVLLVISICDIVAYAHQQLTIHRDIKPANVLVDEHGHVKLLDFGVAKLLADTHSRTQAAFTLASASPEQVENRAVSTATDVYGIGALCYRLLAGHEPFIQQDPAAVLHAVLHDDPEPVQGVPADLWSIIARCLRKIPADRYHSATDLRDDLNRWLNSEPVMAMRGGHWYLTKKFVRRHAVLSATAGLLLIFGLTYTTTVTRQNAIINSERAIALAEAERSENLLSFLVDSISELNTGVGEATTVNEFLDKTIERAALLEDDESKARVMLWLGSAVNGIGRRAFTDEQVEVALNAFENTSLRGSTDHVTLLSGIAEMYLKADELAIAETHARQATQYARESGNFGDELYSSAMLAWLLNSQGNEDAARTVLKRARAIVDAHESDLSNGDDGAMVYILSGTLATSPQERYDYAERAYVVRQPFVQGSRGMLRELVTLGVAENGLRRFADAEKHFMEAYELAKASAEGPPLMAWYLLQELTRTYVMQMDFVSAETYLTRSDELIALLGTDNPSAVSWSRQVRAALNIEAGNLIAARTILAGIELSSDKSSINDQHALTARLRRAANELSAAGSGQAAPLSADAVLLEWRQAGCEIDMQPLIEVAQHFHQLAAFAPQDLEILAVLQHCGVTGLPAIDARAALTELVGPAHWRLAGFSG